MKKQNIYDASSISIYQNAELVRKRPTIYVYDKGYEGAFQLLREVISNSVDEHLSHHCSSLKVTMLSHTSFEIEDNGRGIPTDKHEKTKEAVITSLFTLIGSGGKFGSTAYKSSTAGLNGCGLVAVNALSSLTEVWTKREGKIFHQSFSQGKVKTPLKKDNKKPLKKGTIVRFTIDPEIFGKTIFKEKEVLALLKSISCLCPKLAITFVGLTGKIKVFESGGISDLLKQLSPVFENGDPIVLIPKSKNWELAFGWNWSVGKEYWDSYVNVSPTPEGGTHVDGARNGIAASLGKWSKNKLSTKDFRESLFGVIHLFEKDPLFISQAKTKLSGDGVSNRVKKEVEIEAAKWFTKNHKIAKLIVEKCLEVKTAKEEFRKLRSTLSSGRSKKIGLPPKLTQSPKCEHGQRQLYLVEGDSAGGSAIKARDPFFQEILPLKGKVINCHKKSLGKILENNEFQDIIKSIGSTSGLGKDFSLKTARVGEVYLLADGDEDGRHIEALLLTFFIKYMPDIIEKRKLFIVQSPLFMGEYKGKFWYGDSLAEIQKSNAKALITRFKGHGEANWEHLKNYAFDKGKRKLVQVTMKRAEKALLIMSEDVGVRKKLLGLL